MGTRTTWTRQDTFDVALATALVLLVFSVLAGLQERGAGNVAAAGSLAVAHTIPVAGRRRVPRSAFAVSTSAGFAYLAVGLPMVGLGLAALVMIYSLAAAIPRAESLAGLIVAEVGMLTANALARTDVQFDTVAGNVVVLGVAWFIGDSVRRRRDQAAIERDLVARQAVAEERLRIARELHDVVAHSMSAVTVQAGMARMVIDDDPALAKRSLAAIERTGHQALDEMRRLLYVLRSDDGVAAERAPAPTLADLDELLDQARRSGTRIDVSAHGDPSPVPPGVQLAAFRVVQEALTNVRKHAPGSRAWVTLVYDDHSMTIHVESELGPGPRPPGDGHGLAGMRERIGLYAGELEAGPTGDSFRIRARIPFGDERQ